ncbi:protein LURP-one-related 11-like isoform X1 [Actinidia eriantha]|uniref:protein LURP-one-related 11-like isoform X1 n=1 Tax=Actinidia eriantha TaxID=165200 RepID=UPI0025845AD5|nr:protein LURP-one-related 11-like isoform X1 [Actinidia eriantha]
MTKVHPKLTASSTSSKQEVFTLWMKSLVLNGNGCTVFDSKGEIVYRVDNYNQKCSHEVHLMDLRGNVLFTILKKKSKVLRCWEGYRSAGADLNRGDLGFQVKKSFRILKGDSICEVVVGFDKNQQNQYKMESRSSNSSWKIIDNLGGIVAEEKQTSTSLQRDAHGQVKQKISACGVVLGDDVLTMVVDSNMDPSLVMGLIVVNSLIHQKM